MRALEVPAGFEARTGSGGATLVVLHGEGDAALAAGLEHREAWERALREGSRAGRGTVARIDLPGGRRWVLKSMRRGGLGAVLWRDRFPGTARLTANLEIPGIVRQRGVATPQPTALLAVPGPPGLWRGFLATREVPGGIDLLTLLARRPAEGESSARNAVLAMREAHDAGLRHPDLNLGNFLVQQDSGRVWVLDLDRASWGPLPPSLHTRREALQRLRRSYLKRFGGRGPLAEGYFDRWVDVYSEGHPEWRAVLGRERALERVALALRAVRWRSSER